MLFFILRGPNSSENLSNMSCVPFGLQVQIYAIILKYNAEKRKNCGKSSNRERKNAARVFFNTFGVLQNTFGLLTDTFGVLTCTAVDGWEGLG